MFATATAESVELSESKAKQIVAEWVRKAEMEGVDFPLTTADVVRVLRDGAEFAIDEERLSRLGELGQLPSVSQWDARDIIAAAGCLEGRRQWRTTPSIHDAKKHATRLAVEQTLTANPVDGFRALLDQMRGLDLELALILLAECDNRELRERLLNNVKILMAAEMAQVS